MSEAQEEYRALEARIGGISSPSNLRERPSLASMEMLMTCLGHPEGDFEAIHVGGTAGKSSTVAFLAEILAHAGYAVGRHIKPHLSRVTERIAVNGVQVTTAELAEVIRQAEACIRSAKATWFEMLTALAFMYFAKRKIDIAVVEVGLGGLFDATNVLPDPAVSVITNVGLDHTHLLGDTVEKIAVEKMGIIKQGGTVIAGVRQPAIVRMVVEQCRKLGVPVWLVDRDFSYSIKSMSRSGSTFDLNIQGQRFADVNISEAGAHQVQNASVAAAAACVLAERGFRISEEKMRGALAGTSIPGRLEVVQESPTVVLDGAHSPPKMEALAAALSKLYAIHERLIGVFAFSKGHDAKDSLAEIAPLLDVAIMTKYDVDTDYGSHMAQDPYRVRDDLLSLRDGIEIHVEESPDRAVAKALAIAGEKDIVCVTGSIYLVGQVRPSFVKGR